MDIIQKSELFLQMYGQYYNYHQQLGDDEEIPLLNFLICKNTAEALCREGIPFAIRMFKNHAGTPYPAIVMEDVEWSLYGPSLVNDIKRGKAQEGTVYSASNFVAEFSRDHPETVEKALDIEKNGLVFFRPLRFNASDASPDVSLLSVSDHNHQKQACLMFNRSSLLDSVTQNPLSSLHAEACSFDNHHYQWSALESIPVSTNPLTDFFFLHPESSFSEHEFSELFFALDGHWQSANGNDTSYFKESFSSIQSVQPLLRETPNEHTASLFFSPSTLSLVDGEFQSRAFQYHFEVKTNDDFKRMSQFLIALKNSSFFGYNASIPHHPELSLEDLTAYSMVGNFVANRNIAYQMSPKYVNSYADLEPSLPLVGHLPALIRKIQYDRDIRPVASPKPSIPSPRF